MLLNLKKVNNKQNIRISCGNKVGSVYINNFSLFTFSFFRVIIANYSEIICYNILMYLYKDISKEACV